MSNFTFLTVRRYAELWEKHEQTIYRRIDEGKILTIPEPDGGKCKIIPVCHCDANYFPGRSICLHCKKELEAKYSKK